MRRTTTTAAERSRKLTQQLFSTDAFLSVNKKLLQKTGPVLAVYIHNLVDKFNYFAQNKMLDNGTGFYLTHVQQTEQIALSDKQLRKCKKQCMEMGILTTYWKGVPGKEHYVIDFDRLSAVIMGPKKGATLGVTKRATLGVTKRATHLKENKDKGKQNEALSKDNAGGLSATQCKEASNVIDKWNEMDGATKHKTPTTKVYQQACDLINNLLKGLPLHHKKDHTPSARFAAFCKTYGIGKELYARKWLPAEIVETLQQITQSSEYDGRALPQVLYNAFAQGRKGHSMFLAHHKKMNVSAECLDLADYLAAALEKELTPEERQDWALEFDDLLDTRYTAERLKQVIDWYSKENKDSVYAFAVNDADEFAEKLPRMSSMMQRKKKSKIKNGYSNPNTDWDALQRKMPTTIL